MWRLHAFDEIFFKLPPHHKPKLSINHYLFDQHTIHWVYIWGFGLYIPTKHYTQVGEDLTDL